MNKVIILKFLFHYLSALNIFDAIITWIGIELSMIEEANPIMEILFNFHPGLFMLVKLSLSGFLYAFLLLNQVPQTNTVAIITLLATVIYTFNFLLHCSWILQVH